VPDIPLKEGLFYSPKSPEEKPYLIGSRCRVCGYTDFPEKKVCVRCRRPDTVEKIRLGERAMLETYTVMRVSTPDFSAPYMIGYVRTKEGALIFTHITGCDMADDALTIGEEMELIIEKIKEDSQGNPVIGWKYRPIRRDGR
jgi:uncharacterized OB-fold protein